MTRVQLRTDPEQALGTNTDIALDWYEERSASTIQYEPAFLQGLTPSPLALDLFRLGGAVFCTDKTVRRSSTSDAWTRDLHLTLPVSDVQRWESTSEQLGRTLSFLSGDRWHVDFVADTREPASTPPLDSGREVVSLFSGGLDSLSGVIDLLEGGHQLVLVGHHDSAFADSKQKQLFAELRAQYGDDRLVLKRLLLRPASRSPRQAQPLPASDGENTTRSRSFLFLAAGVAVASGLGPRVPLFIPENGFIGINVPLTGARSGSFSTRTTHPLYMAGVRSLLDSLALEHPIENPYRLMTKGEALAQSSNEDLLRRLAPDSVSCSHPESARWTADEQGNCGHCFPCLIRRASLHAIGEDDPDGYRRDALQDSDLLTQTDRMSGRSLRALLASLSHPAKPMDVLRNGRIPNGEVQEFFDVYVRGRSELRSWFESGGSADIQRRVSAGGP